jgi:hypothetical protein
MTEADWRWWAVGLFVGLWLLSTRRMNDWALLPVLVALGPMSVVFYIFATLAAGSVVSQARGDK